MHFPVTVIYLEFLPAGKKIERVSTLSRLKGEACLSQYQTLGSGFWCVVGHISTTRCASSGWERVHEEAAISEYGDPNLLYVLNLPSLTPG